MDIIKSELVLVLNNLDILFGIEVKGRAVHNIIIERSN